MSQQLQASSSPVSGEQGGSRLGFCAILFFCIVLACTIVSALGGFILTHISSSSSLDPTPLPVPTAPTTPPVYGLSGQATCRHLAPPTTSPWLSVARDDAQKYQIDTLAFEWQIWQESKFDPDARSSAGAIGIAQFLPEVAATQGIDPTNPTQSLDAAARIDRNRLRDFATRSSRLAEHYGGDSAHYAYGLVLAAYNAGSGAVESAWSRTFPGQTWPPGAWDWLTKMPNETRNYVPAILGCL
jgi:soluble lytic murein transglycosylase-like protein